MASAPRTVTIDGPAGSGKSTVARRVAALLGYTLLDTGAIYRALALAAREAGVDWEDGPALAALAARLDLRFEPDAAGQRVRLGNRDVSAAIRTPEISHGASRVSRHPEVRQALLDLQRAFARRGPLVAEGRDTGTVVFPGAAVKVYLTAAPEERARRRHAELVAAGKAVSFDEVLAAERRRDEADATREVAPMRPADDAEVIDTTGLDVDAVVARVLDVWRRRTGGSPPA